MGHDIQIVIDDEDEFTYIANDGFSYNVGSATEGKLRFQIPDQLDAGYHKLKLTVFDAYNNGVSQELNFRVTQDLIISSLKNYPNPFKDQTNFVFSHNREGDELDISIQVYSTLGELMAVIDRELVNSAGTHTISWDGVGDSNAKLSNGLYIYQLVIRSKLDGEIGTKTGKLYIDN